MESEREVRLTASHNISYKGYEITSAETDRYEEVLWIDGNLVDQALVNRSGIIPLVELGKILVDTHLALKETDDVKS